MRDENAAQGLRLLKVGITLVGILGICSAPAASADKSFKLGYSVGFLTDPFQAIQVNKTLAKAKEAGIVALPVANANQDAGKQIADFHNLIAEGAQGIMVVATDSDAIIPALNFAAEKKVPVVSIDIGPSGGTVAMIVRSDNLRMGRDVCQALGKSLGGKGTALSLLGDQATINGRDRTVAFNECMKKDFPDIKVIEQPTYWKTDKATAAAQTVVTSTPDLGAIYMQSDSVMSAGVINVLKSSGKLKKVGEAGHIFLAGIDGTPYAIQQVRDGWMDVSISQPLDLYVKYGLDYLQRAVNGEKFQKGPTDHDSQIAEYNGNLMDLLPATVVTSANVDDPSVWANSAK
jgi:ribose transport system substrate-binding protein